MVDLHSEKLTVSRQAELLSLNRSSLYYEPAGVSDEEFRLEHGWMYLAAVIDGYSRYIVRWELDQTLEIDFVLKATKTALGQAKPEIWNSDQGSHFTSPQYTDILKEAGVKIRMGGKNRAVDNIYIERFWRTLKYYEVYTKEYATPREARNDIRKFIHKYNHERPHPSLRDHTPAELYLMGMKPEDRIPTRSRPNTYIGEVRL